jgi:tryptophanyl-tRNA synthetase
LFSSYRELKEAVADSVVATLGPIQARYADLRDDPGTVRDILADGARQARDQVRTRVRQVRERLGLR